MVPLLEEVLYWLVADLLVASLVGGVLQGTASAFLGEGLLVAAAAVLSRQLKILRFIYIDLHFIQSVKSFTTLPYSSK